MKTKNAFIDEIRFGKSDKDIYILSIECIMKNPEIMYWYSDSNIILLDFIYNEIKKLSIKSFYFKEILNVIHEKNIPIKDTDIEADTSWLYAALMEFSKTFVEENSSNNVFLVADTKTKKTKSNFVIISCNDFTLRNINTIGNFTLSRINFAKRADNIVFIFNILASLIIFILGILYFGIVIESVAETSKYLSIIYIPIVGLLLYMYRCWFRLSYGIVEFFLGCYIAISLFFGANQLTFSTVDWVKLLGGLYIVVRGFDNIGKGLESTRFSYLWSSRFKDIKWSPMKKSNFEDF